MNTAIRLSLYLFLVFLAPLWAAGDFAGGREWTFDKDVYYTPPSCGQQLVRAAAAAACASSLTLVLLGLSGLMVKGWRLIRLLLSLWPVCVGLVYLFGDFKELMDGPPTYEVLYDLSPGLGRLEISLPCGAVLALVIGAFGAMFGILRSPAHEGKRKT